MEENLNKLKEILVDSDCKQCQKIIELFDSLLDDALTDDFFGSSGQNDPRGDQRDAHDLFYENNEDDEGAMFDPDLNGVHIESVDDAIMSIDSIIYNIEDHIGLEDYLEPLFDKYCKSTDENL